MERDLISVIVTVHNRERYLRRCLDSVMKQKDVNFEVLLIDDGSTDSSADICDEYSQKFDNVSVIHQENQGLSKARNVGLDNVNGNYIAFVDDDDFIPEDNLKKLLFLQKENQADMVISNYAEYSDEGEYIKTFKIPDKYCNKILSKREVCEILSFANETHVIIVSWGKLFKKEVWDNVRFPVGIIIGEDQFVFPALMEKCKRIYLTDEVLYNQVFSKTSNVRGERKRRHLYHSQGIVIVATYLIEQGYYDIALYKFGEGTRHFISLKRILKDEECQNEIKRQYKDYKKLAEKLFFHVNFKNKLRFILFFINLDLYGFIRDKTAKS